MKKPTTKKKTSKKVTIRRARRNPTITLDDIDRIGGNVARALVSERGIDGLFLRRESGSFEYMRFDRSKITKIYFDVNKGQRGLRFTVKINSSQPRYYDVNENGNDVYWFLKDLFTGELK